MGSLKWIAAYMKPYKWWYVLGFSLVFIVQTLNMANPYFAGRIIDKVVQGGDKAVLIPILLSMIAITLSRTGLRYTFQILFEFLSQKILFTIRADLYRQLDELDYAYYDRSKTGEIMSRVTGDLEAVRHNVAWTIYMVVENFTLFLFAVTFMFTIHAPLAASMLVISPITLFFAYNLSRKVGPTFGAIRGQFAKLNAVVQENISGNRVVKAFAREPFEMEKFEVENQAFADRNLDAAKVWSRYLPVLDSLGGFLIVIMIIVGGSMVIRDQMTIGQLVTFNGLIWALIQPMRMMGWHLNDIQRFIASAKKIEELQLEKPIIPVTHSQTSTKLSTIEQLTFDHVSFRYGTSQYDVLHDIHFEAKAGQTIAIVGPTGSGKTTLIQLLSRYYDVTAGAIRLNGKDVRDLHLRDIRANVAVAMQDVFLFSDTIEGNIAYGVPDASMEDVRKAARDADAESFIEALSEGYDTIIGERGVGLSGGQRQRISLSRALLKDAPVLVLDDTTSAVDLETELRILKALQQRMANKITIIIAHRISSVKDADQILVFEHGRIIERGTHAELLAQEGHYFDVYNNQMGLFAREVSGDGA